MICLRLLMITLVKECIDMEDVRKIKVFLVEDEVVIRSGIKSKIDWSDNGFEFVGEAGDGELAYPKIMETTPDILITDIKMPFVNGLELSKLVKKEIPDIKIVLLTGYDEFEYAKEAIDIGVTEYLLKPISSDKLLETLTKIKDTILRESEDKELLLRYNMDMKENNERNKLKFLNRILSSDMSMTKLLEEAESFDMDFSRSYYNVIIFNAFPKGDNEEGIVKVNEVLDLCEKKFVGNSSVYTFQKDVEGLVFIVCDMSEEGISKICDETVSSIKEVCKDYDTLRYFVGVGKTVMRVHNLKDAYVSAERAFSRRFDSEKSDVLYIEKYEEQLSTDVIKENSFVEIESIRRSLEKFISLGGVDEVSEYVDGLMRKLDGDYINSVIMRQYIIMDVYVVCMSKAESDANNENTDEVKVISEFKNRMTSVNNRDDVYAFIKDIITETINYREIVNTKKFSKLINRVKHVIEEEYVNRDFSLGYIADKLAVNKSYLSRLFLQETGETFTDYLLKFRLKKGEELLANTDMTVTAISLEIGYNDPHYFSYVYKKERGYTPRDYRIKMRNVDEE